MPLKKGRNIEGKKNLRMKSGVHCQCILCKKKSNISVLIMKFFKYLTLWNTKPTKY